MENNRSSDESINKDPNSDKTRQQQNSKEVSFNGFSGMNYEQERERYRMRKEIKTRVIPNRERTVQD